MAAFNLNQVSGLGNHILSEVSKGARQGRIKIQYISYKDIAPNPKNAGYSKDNIIELADSIRLSGGIKQPCIVKPFEDGYMLLTGERRWLAVKHLTETEEDDRFEMIPCQVENPEDIDLPLETDDKELFSILVTNQYREKSDADLFFEHRHWKDLIKKLRDAGISEMAFFDAAGNEETRNIKGVKTRQLVSEQMGVSAAQVGKMEKIDNNGSDELIESVEQGDLSIYHASMISGLDKEQQDEIVEDLKNEERVTDTVIREKIDQFSKNDRKNELPDRDFINPPEDDEYEEGTVEEAEDDEEEAADIYLDDEMIEDLNGIVQYIVECPHYWVNEKQKANWKRLMKEIWNFLEV